MKWLKCSNTIALDPKFGIVANLSKSYKHEVLAVWIYLLGEASAKNEKGFLGKPDFDAIDYALDLLKGRSEKIYMALTVKELITPDGYIKNWTKHQADPTAAERQRKSRERKKELSQDVTPCHSDITESHAVTVEEKRGEEKREDKNIDDDDKAFVKISKQIQERMKGRILQTQRVQAWLQAGADESLILQVIDEVMQKKDGEPPNSLMYFEPAITQALANKNKPLKEGKPHGYSRNGTGVSKHSGFSKQDYAAGTEGFEVIR